MLKIKKAVIPKTRREDQLLHKYINIVNILAEKNREDDCMAEILITNACHCMILLK